MQPLNYTIKKCLGLLGTAAISALLLLSWATWTEAASELTDKGYQLDQIVMFSRHNLRTSITSEDSSAATMMTHPMPKWQVPRGNLTMKGGVNETILGQYFQLYLMDEGFMPDSWQPGYGQVDFYANSYERTIATARYFATGLLPTANITVKHTKAVGGHDKVFNKPFAMDTPKLMELAMEYHNEHFQSYKDVFSKCYDSFARVTDFPNSPYAKKHGIDHINTDDLALTFSGKEKNVINYDGTARKAYKLLDPIIMNYYQEADNSKADFGTGLTHKDWENLGAVKTKSIEMVVGNPAVALSHSHDILNIMESDLKNDTLKFAFICGHDTNIFTILTALETEDYSLPETILTKAPLGVKIVFEKRRNPQGDLFIYPYIAYMSDDQQRNSRQLSLHEPPMIYPLSFRGLAKNGDGLYRYEDILALMDRVNAKYEEYCLH